MKLLRMAINDGAWRAPGFVPCQGINSWSAGCAVGSASRCPGCTEPAFPRHQDFTVLWIVLIGIFVVAIGLFVLVAHITLHVDGRHDLHPGTADGGRSPPGDNGGSKTNKKAHIFSVGFFV